LTPFAEGALPLVEHPVETANTMGEQDRCKRRRGSGKPKTGTSMDKRSWPVLPWQESVV